MTAKLRIDLSQGIIEVEGDVEFVREVYGDFSERISESEFVGKPDGANDPSSLVISKTIASKAKAKPKRAAAKKPKAVSNESGIDPNHPKLDKNLDTAGLPRYYEQFDAKNIPEKILIFLKFMNDELGLETPNTDQFFTCFDAVKERIPQAFRQAFLDTSGKRFGYIDYSLADGVSLTIKGRNHFDAGISKKGDE